MIRVVKIFIVFFVVSLPFLGCEEKLKPSVIQTIDSRLLPQQESWNSDIVVSDSGHVHAIIHAGNIRVFENDHRTQLSQGVTVHFFSAEGHETSVLTSAEGSVDETTNNLEADNHVVAVSTNGSRLVTERLFWDNVRQLIHTPEYVEITTPKEKIHGHGFESDQTLKNYKIFVVTGQGHAE
ncbi:MAG TPA: LPS export ABC transporter periplasmic protein LptC [Bacteroidota bacterium]|nr:LPS export ABC transporter periplasmic protein LptC [Bacteroidota bacterium]